MTLASAAASEALLFEPPQWWMWFVYLLVLVLGLGGSAVFSGLETAIYSMSRLRLIVRQSRGEPLASLLRDEIADSQRTISTLLISNNLCNFAVSFAVTAILTRLMGWSEQKCIVVQALLLTPLLFIFAETIPKEIGRSRADVVVYPLAPLLRLVRRVYFATGVLWFFQASGRWLSNRLGGSMAGAVLSARARITALIEEGVGHGTLSTRQTDIVDRALALRTMTVRQRMAPWRSVQTIRAHENLQVLRARHASLAYARYPVLGEADEVIGVLDLMDLIAAAPETTARDVARPAPFLDESLDARSAVAVLRRESAVMGIVGRAGRPVGIVTLRGLVEPLISTDAPERSSP